MSDFKVTKDTYLSELIEQKPEAAYILMSYGMACVGCPASLMETVEEASMVHGINLDRLMADLERL
ncbi:DUF1858 domain-containing protein [uncultured Ezakiella sp.]|uniref:DUF1858 domain-containing protein n=1 Tax=uncultured Ezakiella sp. TaxID=1637529 RepID=UPI0025EAF2F6|nr:DUF1858 domain-containing protein [uncultured Ezakiella sp.]